MQELIHTKEAGARIQAHLPRLSTVECALAESAGRILREPIVADRALPPFDRAMMDGYAIRAADLGQTAVYTVVGQAPAGAPQLTRSLNCGEAIEIMTGAVLPCQADAVIPYEDTELTDGGFRIIRAAEHSAGDAVHTEGSDHAAGETLVPAGCVLNSHVAAVAATCGYARLTVSRIPSIAILSTGDEAVPIESRPLAHQIRRSNGLAVQTALARAGLPGAVCRHIADTPEASKQTLEAALADHDFIIITGGISKGRRDYVPEALNQLGLHCHFHGVRQKPGKPFAYWSGHNTGIFALPGNPLSVLVCLHHYTIPAIRSALGESPARPQPVVSLAAGASSREDLTRFFPLRLGADGLADPCPPSNSGDLVRILRSDGYAVFYEGEPITAGSRRPFYPWY